MAVPKCYLHWPSWITKKNVFDSKASCSVILMKLFSTAIYFRCQKTDLVGLLTFWDMKLYNFTWNSWSLPPTYIAPDWIFGSPWVHLASLKQSEDIWLLEVDSKNFLRVFRAHHITYPKYNAPSIRGNASKIYQKFAIVLISPKWVILMTLVFLAEI